MSLKKRIALTICLLMVVMLLSISFAIYKKSASILHANAVDYMEIQLNRAQEQIDGQIGAIQLQTEKYAGNPQVRTYMYPGSDLEDINGFLTEEMDKLNGANDFYKDLFVVDKSGHIVSSTMPEAMGISLASRDYVQESVLTKDTVTSDILYARSDGTMIVNTITPIYNDTSQVLGYFGIAVKADHFSKFIEDYQLGEKGYYAIIDSNNQILSHPDPEKIGTHVTDTSYSRYIGPLEHGTGFDENNIMTVQNEQVLEIMKRMSSNNWVLIASLPQDELKTTSVSLLIYVVLMGGLGIIIAILLGLFISGKISKPIVAITEHIDHLTASNHLFEQSLSDSKAALALEMDGKSESEDEINNLTRSFHQFNQRFNELVNQMENESSDIIKKSEQLTYTMEKRNYSTLTFISTLSHDLRTSITLIRGYAKGLMDGVIQDEAVQKKFLKGIYDSSEYLEKLTLDILDTAYDASYEQSLRLETIHLTNWTDSLIRISTDYIRGANHKVAIHQDLRENASLTIDRVKLLRVWQNLLSNAVKYSPESSLITIDMVTAGDRLTLAVEDRGIGISEEDQNGIFELFYKGDVGDKSSYGLGLFIAKAILEAHGAELHFTSTLGQGSRFWFTLELLELK